MCNKFYLILLIAFSLSVVQTQEVPPGDVLSALEQFNTKKADADALCDSELVFEGDEKLSFSWYKRSAEQGNLWAQNKLATMYCNGEGVKKNTKEALRWYSQAAEKGNKEAQYNLASMYETGEGVQQDDAKAFSWYQKAAKLGHVQAQYKLAKMYREGKGVERDDESAFEWYQNAVRDVLGSMPKERRKMVRKEDQEVLKWYTQIAQKGGKEDLYRLAWMHEQGLGTYKNDEKAAELYEQAARKGHVKSQYKVGWFYYFKANKKGHQADQQTNYKTALRWFNRAAHQGDAQAQNRLGNMYENGLGVVQDEREALKWYNQAAEQGNIVGQSQLKRMSRQGKILTQDEIKKVVQAAQQGDIKAQEKLAEMYKLGRGVSQSDERAWKWYNQAAKQGSTDAQKQVDEMYVEGRGAEQNDRNDFKLFSRLAEEGNVLAKYNLAMMYYKGIGVNRNEKKATEWYREFLADTGDAEAQYVLAEKHLTGDEVEQDDEKAFEWYKKAAEQGHTKAQYKLSWMYQTGTGVSQNHQQAYAWLHHLSRNTPAYAQNKDILTASMTPAQISESKKIAQKLSQEINKKEKKEENVSSSNVRALILAAIQEGDVEAQYELGRIYYAGEEGVKKDKIQAYAWMHLASVNSTVKPNSKIRQEAIKNKNRYQDAMTSYQVAVAKSLATKLSQEIAKGKNNQLANQADAEDQYNLGSMYATGYVVSQNDEKALEWYRRAAYQGHKKAQYELGHMYDKTGDKVRAYAWMNVAMTGRDGLKGSVYKEGRDSLVESISSYRQISEAKKLSQKLSQSIGKGKTNPLAKQDATKRDDNQSVNKEIAEAQNELAELALAHTEVVGTSLGDEQILEQYKEAKERGDVEAQYKIASILESIYEKRGLLKPAEENDKYRARILYLYVEAAKGGHAEAQYKVASMYGSIYRNNQLAFKWYKRAAENGQVNAQSLVASMYDQGTGVGRDREQAFYWYKKSIRSVKDQLDLARKYKDEKDYPKSFELYKGLAEKGNKEAQRSLAEMYKLGQGVERDKEQAFYWYKQAIRSNEEQFDIASAYHDEKDYLRAFELYSDLIKKGHDRAKRHLGALMWSYKEEHGLNKTLDFYHDLAQKGVFYAQKKLAEMYYSGEGVPQDKKKAFDWYEKLAESGDVEAQRRLAERYEKGEGVPQDKNKAFDWYEKLAENGDSEAQRKVADTYYNGEGVPQDKYKALYWYQKLAESGDSEAQRKVAQAYFKGEGVQQNYKRAFEWYERLGEKGTVEDQFNLAEMYYKGQGVKRNYEKAMYWYRATDRNSSKGHRDARAQIAKMYDEGLGVLKSINKAIEWYKKAAELGHVKSQQRLDKLGINYEASLQRQKTQRDGESVQISQLQKPLSIAKAYYKNQNYDEAFKKFQELANQGHVEAQRHVAMMYDYGQGVGQSDERAFSWYKKAAEKGNIEAQSHVAWMYDYGIGVKKDRDQARYWYRQLGNHKDQKDFYVLTSPTEVGALYNLAKKGDAKAQHSLGWRYTYYKDFYFNSFYWFMKAAEQGNEEAQYRVGLSYQSGRGVTQDHKKSVEWYEKAAKQWDNPLRAFDAQYQLVEIYAQGEEGVPQNNILALAWLGEADHTAGINKRIKESRRRELQELNQIEARLLREMSNDERAKAREIGSKIHKEIVAIDLTKSAEQGDASSQYKLAKLYEIGSGVEKNEKQACYWHERAAKQGSMLAQYKLGECYKTGSGVEKDEKQAFYWHERAAKQGHDQAQYNVGKMYMEGRGVSENREVALEWYQRSADQGNTEAQSELGTYGTVKRFFNDLLN